MAEGKDVPQPDKNTVMWADLLRSLDTSSLGKSIDYPAVAHDRIDQVGKEDPLMASFLTQSNIVYEQSRDQAEGLRSRERRYHEQGWRIFIDTPRGIVFLNSGPFGNFFELSYPKVPSITLQSLSQEDRDKVYQAHLDSVDASKSQEPNNTKRRFTEADQETREILLHIYGSEHLKEISEKSGVPIYDSSSEITVPDDVIEGVLGVENAQAIVSFEGKTRKWAKFWGPPEIDGGRVWVDATNIRSRKTNPMYLDDEGNIQYFMEGQDDRSYIDTYPYTFADNNPDGPTTDQKAIQKYRDKFIALTSLIAFAMGGPKSVTVEFTDDTIMVPQDFYRENYTDVTWTKGELGDPPGFHTKQVRAKKGDSIVMLDSREMVPWSVFLHTTTRNITSPKSLAGFLKEDFLNF